MDFSDDTPQPFEYQLENENKQRKAAAPKKTKQTTLGFQKSAPPPDDSDSDDDDDDDDDLKGFDFGQHKPKASASAAPPKLSSMRDEDEAEGKKKKKAADERTLVSSRWPRGGKALPAGWTARQYRIGKGKDFWVFSHPYWGETQQKKDLDRSEDEWGEVLAKRHRLSGGKPSSRRDSGVSAASGDGDGEAEGEAEDDDGLAALLNGKRKREEEDEVTRQEVHEEMSLRMDTGVRVNKALAQAMLR